MSSPSTRLLLRELLTGADVGARIQECDDNTLAEFAALAPIVCGMLVSRRFSMPDDERIRPFVDSLMRLNGLSEGMAARTVDALIRTLLGDPRHAESVPPQQLTVLQVLVSRAVVSEQNITPVELDQILDQAEPLASLAIQRIADGVEPTQPAVSRATTVRVTGMVGERVLLAVASCVLVTFIIAAFGAPGFLSSRAQSAARPQSPSISTPAPAPSPPRPPSATPEPTESPPSATTTTRPSERISPEGMRVIRLVIARINADDLDSAEPLICEDQRSLVRTQLQALMTVKPRLRVEPDPAESVPPSVTGRITGVTVFGSPVEGYVVATNLLGSEYCVMSFQLT